MSKKFRTNGEKWRPSIAASIPKPATENSNTAIRLTEMLCRLPASQIN